MDVRNYDLLNLLIVTMVLKILKVKWPNSKYIYWNLIEKIVVPISAAKNLWLRESRVLIRDKDLFTYSFFVK